MACPIAQGQPNPSAIRIRGTMMSFAADSNTATRNDKPAAGSLIEPTAPDEAVDQALQAAVKDAGRIGDLLDVLRSARLWLPLPDGGEPVITGSAVTLPTVSYLGSEFVPAYSSADLMHRFARPAGADQPAPAESPPPLPHAVIRAADLARLLPPSIGIALNAGATESVPVYPQGVSYLAADGAGEDAEQISVGPLPVRPDPLLAAIGAGLLAIQAVRAAAAAWLTVRFAGEGLLVSVTLDDPADATVRDLVIGAVERAAWEVTPEEAGFPIDVTFPGERQPDRLDELIAAAATSFYRRP
jgi:SseB protein N-terminal domain